MAVDHPDGGLNPFPIFRAARLRSRPEFVFDFAMSDLVLPDGLLRHLGKEPGVAVVNGIATGCDVIRLRQVTMVHQLGKLVAIERRIDAQIPAGTRSPSSSKPRRSAVIHSSSIFARRYPPARGREPSNSLIGNHLARSPRAGADAVRRKGRPQCRQQKVAGSQHRIPAVRPPVPPVATSPGAASGKTGG